MRLIDSDAAPARGGPDAAVARALAASLALLAAEAADAADDTIAAADHVAAADARTDRAARDAYGAALAREHVSGRSEVLENELDAARAMHRAIDQDLAAARDRETALERVDAERRGELAGTRAALEHARDNAAELVERLATTEASLTHERTERGVAARSHATALAAETARAAALDVRLAATVAERTAAVARADEIGARLGAAEAARDAARKHAIRLDAALEGSRRDAHVARVELEATRRTLVEVRARVTRRETRPETARDAAADTDDATPLDPAAGRSAPDVGGIARQRRRAGREADMSEPAHQGDPRCRAAIVPPTGLAPDRSDDAPHGRRR